MKVVTLWLTERRAQVRTDPVQRFVRLSHIIFSLPSIFYPGATQAVHSTPGAGRGLDQQGAALICKSSPTLVCQPTSALTWWLKINIRLRPAILRAFPNEALIKDLLGVTWLYFAFKTYALNPEGVFDG